MIVLTTLDSVRRKKAWVGFYTSFNVNVYSRHRYHLMRKKTNDYLARISHNAVMVTEWL